jgi:hypothetical protein
MRARWFPIPVLLATGLLAVIGASTAAPATAPGRLALRVIPFPGTPDAAPSSAIIFSSLAPTEVHSVHVLGSRSGVHSGRLEALPDGAGTAFVPGRPFSAGERVQVGAELTSPAAGTAAGDPGATRLSFRFGVAVPAAQPASASDASSSAHTTGGPPTRSFHSARDLHPPVVSVSADPDRSSGDIFLTPSHSSQAGPMILNPQGQLVWFDSVRGAFNLQVQRYQGQPVLTWWQAGVGGNVIANRSYQRVAVVRAGHGYTTDAHDFEIASRGTAWLLGIDNVTANLTSVGGPSDGTVYDFVIQKVDIPTGTVLWEWHAYGHIPLNASYKRPRYGHYDAYHLNSLQQLPDGNLLVSSRSTWSVYKISTTTGRILWTLGGKYNQFKMRPGTHFEWQHDAQRSGNTLTLFDDADAPQEEGQSSAKELDLHVSARKVGLIHRYTHTPPLLSSAQGSTQLLPNGNVFVGWGTEPDFSEYTPGGRQIFRGSFPLSETSYRAFRFPWTGHPQDPPAVAITAGEHGAANVWASWNGATSVAAWRVRGGASCRSVLRTVAKVSRAGFETEITLRNPPACLQVQALNAAGEVLGTSSAQPVG